MQRLRALALLLGLVNLGIAAGLFDDPLFAGHGSGQCTGCPPLWTQREGQCYWLTGLMSWPQARQACRRAGGSMAAPHSKEENDFILELASGLPLSDVQGIWIDCQDRQLEGHWLCEGRNGPEDSFTHWDTSEDEPNNRGDEDCAAIHRQRDDGVWMDIACDTPMYPAICRRDCVVMHCFTADADGRIA